MLEITLARLRGFGIREAIINVHHFPDMVVEYLKKNNNFGMRIEVSREEELLDTGGGLQKAAHFLKDSGGHSKKDGSFILHNVDVLSTIDLDRMRLLHHGTQALATLAVQDRETSRYLLFDEEARLCGRRSGREQIPQLVRACEQPEALAFSGIHVISPRLFAMMSEQGAFSIIDAYLRLAGQGEKIMSFRADNYYWRDLGRPEGVAQAEKDLENKVISV
jgi:NDP-sugar pyrophosphorylase family protein